MPSPVSSTSSSVCDPTLASCADSPPAAPPPSAARPATVDIPPVVITGDAGAQALLRRYDASQACGPQEKNAALAGAGIPAAIKDGGPLSAFVASITAVKELAALADCEKAAQALESSAEKFITYCHDRDGNVSAGASPNEIICEVP
jgi:hypothetical protein